MVEWKKLSDVAVIKNGKDYKKLSYGTIPVYGTGGIMTHVDQFASDKPSVLLPRKGSVENIFYVDEPFWTVDTLYWTEIDISKINPKFLFISLQRYNLKEFAYGGARPSLSQQILYNLDIPLPSLSEQERIVGILDTFTASIDNLKEQIAQRRKQYEYYRDQLLDLEGKEGVEMKKIKDVCIKICSGGTPSTSKHEYYGGSIPWLRTQEVDWKEIYDTEIKITEEAIAHSSAKIIPANCVIVAMYGATAAKVAINKIPVSTNQACCNLEIDPQKALYKYVFHWLCKEYQNLKAMGEGSQNNINGQKVKDYPIPAPPLSEQQRIVDILDKFEASIQNLEAQLSQREKQYEYYRNKLLTFE